jgi:NaMN:DMB phosphoribosyltransferase
LVVAVVEHGMGGSTAAAPVVAAVIGVAMEQWAEAESEAPTEVR